MQELDAVLLAEGHTKDVLIRYLQSFPSGLVGYLHRRGESTLLRIRGPKSVCERIDLDLRKSFGTSPDQTVIHNVTDAKFANALVIERSQPGNHLLGSSGDLDAASFSGPHPSFALAHFRSLSDPIFSLPKGEPGDGIGVTAALHMSRATSSVALGAAGIVAGTTYLGSIVQSQWVGDLTPSGWSQDPYIQQYRTVRASPIGHQVGVAARISAVDQAILDHEKMAAAMLKTEAARRQAEVEHEAARAARRLAEEAARREADLEHAEKKAALRNQALGGGAGHPTPNPGRACKD